MTVNEEEIQTPLKVGWDYEYEHSYYDDRGGRATRSYRVRLLGIRHGPLGLEVKLREDRDGGAAWVVYDEGMLEPVSSNGVKG